MDKDNAPNHYQEFLIYSGAYYAAYFHAEASGLSRVHGYFEDCDEVVQATLLHLVRRLAETGRIYDTTKFRIEDRKHRIYCFKAKNERFFCFFLADRKLIISSAYRKRRQNLDIAELKKAINIQWEYVKNR